MLWACVSQVCKHDACLRHDCMAALLVSGALLFVFHGQGVAHRSPVMFSILVQTPVPRLSARRVTGDASQLGEVLGGAVANLGASSATSEVTLRMAVAAAEVLPSFPGKVWFTACSCARCD